MVISPQTTIIYWYNNSTKGFHKQPLGIRSTRLLICCLRILSDWFFECSFLFCFLLTEVSAVFDCEFLIEVLTVYKRLDTSRRIDDRLSILSPALQANLHIAVMFSQALSVNAFNLLHQAFISWNRFFVSLAHLLVNI